MNPTLAVRDEGLATALYDQPKVYPYGNLFAYHYGRKRLERLDDAAAARRYFETFDPERPAGCARGRIGHGVPVF